MSNVISISTECLDLYSASVCYNKIKLISSITVKNISDFNLKNLELEISSSPSFFADYCDRIGELSSGRYLRLSDIELSIDTTRLLYLPTNVTSALTLRIISQGEVLCEVVEQVQLLPYDYIPSLTTYPELLSCFVTPMQDEIKDLADKVSSYIDNPIIPANSEMWKKSDREVSYEVIKGVYDAIRDLKITYILTPLFADTKHTKVKLCESVLSSKSANSLELALLFASVVEHLGYNSFVSYHNGKAYAGAFFVDKTFSCPVLDDGRAFLQLSDGFTGDFCVIDPTSLVNGTHIEFEDSARMAHKELVDGEFPTIIDVKECRRCGLNPIFNRIRKDGNIIFEEVTLKDAKKEFVFPKTPSALEKKIKDSVLLLDSSNPLIRFSQSRAAFMVGSVESLSAKFVFNPHLILKSFSFSGVISSEKSEMISTLIKLNKSVSVTDMSDNVSTLYEKKELEKRLLKLMGGDKNITELYLSLGIVSGTVNKKEIFAPLLLAPAMLDYDASSSAFYLSLSKSSVVINKALFAFLNQHTGFVLRPEYERVDISENFAEFYSNVEEDLREFANIELINACALIRAPFERYLISECCESSWLEKSSVIEKMCRGDEFENKEFDRVTKDDLQPRFFSMPLLMDASQADAYNASLSNECVIVKGPDGSGKTRVAASVAFSALENGETVLYASSSDSNINQFKKYAKDAKFIDFTATVLKNNLQKNSFDESRKTDSDVLNNPDEIRERVESTHAQISSYYRALHKVREIGFSLYETISQYERYKTFPYAVNFTNSEVSCLSREDAVLWFDIVSNLSKAGADCSEPFNNPLMYVRKKEFSYDLKSNSVVVLARYQDCVRSFIEKQNQLADYLGVEVPIIKENQTQSLKNLILLLLENNGYVYPSVFLQKGTDADFLTIESFIETNRNFFESKKFLNEHFTDDILSLDITSLYNDFRNAGLKFAIAKVSAQNAVKNKLKLYARNPKELSVDLVSQMLQKLSEYKNAVLRMVEISSYTRRLFGIDLENEVKKDNTDIFAYLEKCISCSRKYHSLITEIYDSEKKPENVFVRDESLFSNKERFSLDLSSKFEEFSELLDNVLQSEDELISILELDLASAKRDNENIWYYFIEKFLERMIENIDVLKHWCTWNREKEVALNSGLGAVVSLYESEQMTYNDIKNAFLKGFFKTVSEYILSCEVEINNFSKENFELRVNSLLADSDKWKAHTSAVFNNEKTKKTREDVCALTNMSFEDSKMLLKRDFTYNDKFYNVSSSAKNLLLTARPCIISKYTSVLSQLGKKVNFDVLIVDTADKFKWEEITLLLPLAKRVVIMCEDVDKNPLVSFLARKNAPCMSLEWIYSYNFCSRLVNKLFYPQSTSFIFPDGDRRGVRVIYQKGTFDRKNSRTNLIEASAVVDEMMKKVDATPSSSFAVIAMTDEQASLIELLFTKRLQSLDEVQRKAFFDRSEPFYISSLEKTSFNPADTVIFSTTFSVEERPKYRDTICRAIPELSTHGAKHNLISALSCARREFVLVTSLTEEMLSKFKTVISGYKVFKELVLTLSDANAQFSTEMNKCARVENSVIRQTINHIESLGYKTDVDIGTNSCRVDIAVKDKNTDGYVLGIIFDETAYVSGGDLISRALITRNLQKNLGWKIMRVYTVEWFENSPKQLDAITRMLTDDAHSIQGISFDRL